MKLKLGQIVIFLIFSNMLFQCQNIDKFAESAENNNSQKMSADENAVTFPGGVSILIPTQYRKKSTGYPKNLKNNKWMELYKDQKTGKWRITKADLQISYGRDECVGEDIMIIKSKNKNAVLFFSKFDGLTENPATILENKRLFPEHPISFKLKGREYLLSPMGNVLDDKAYIIPARLVRDQTEQELADSQMTDYKLAFSVDGNTINLVNINKIEFTTPKIIWMGDLNGDNLPDMILNLSDFYESQHFYFFLSDPADKDEPIKKLAELKVVNDC